MASVSGGITLGPSFSVNPTNIQDVWDIKIGTASGAYGKASLGPQLTFLKNSLKVGPSASTEINFGQRNDIEYTVDLNNTAQIFKAAAAICLAKISIIPDPRIKMFAGFFNNLSNAILPKKSESISTSYGSSIGLGLGIQLENQIENLDGYGNISRLEVGGGITAEGGVNIESKLDKITGVGTNHSLKLVSNYEASAGYDAGISILDNSFVLKNLNYKLFTSAASYKFSMSRDFDTFNNLKGGLVSFGSEKDETINGNPDYKVAWSNNYTYGANVVNFIKGSYANTSVSQNYIGAYLAKGKGLPASLWLPWTNNNSIFKKVIEMQEFVTQNFQNNWAANETTLSTTRDIILRKSPTISFGIGAGLNLDFSIGYNSWNNYTHKFKEAVYSKSLGKRLLTIDMPEIYDNLEIPTTEPMGYFWNKVQEKLSSLIPATVQNAFHGFVDDVLTTIGNALITVFSNEGGTRSLMNGSKIYDAKSKNARLLENIPSFFTFTINPSPQVFNASTALRFQYYFPENELQAFTVNDTLRIVSDVFFLEAKDGSTVLNQAPNGNFTIQTQFSLDDLKLASLPLNSTPVVLFLANGSSVWENIGAANSTINFNRLGSYAIGVKITADNIAPTIVVTPPTSFTVPNTVSVTLSENQSGIDWAKTSFSCNGIDVPFTRVGTTNTFTVPIASLPTNSDNVFTITILTIDFAGNTNSFSQTYPCISDLSIHSLFDDIISQILEKASKTIISDGTMPLNNEVIFRAGNSIDLLPGFEAKTPNKVFKTEIGGCPN